MLFYFSMYQILIEFVIFTLPRKKTLNLRTQILSELKSLQPDLLAQLYQFLVKLKKPSLQNKHPFIEFAGSLTDSEANEIKQQIDREFNKIEGEW